MRKKRRFNSGITGSRWNVKLSVSLTMVIFIILNTASFLWYIMIWFLWYRARFAWVFLPHLFIQASSTRKELLCICFLLILLIFTFFFTGIMKIDFIVFFFLLLFLRFYFQAAVKVPELSRGSETQGVKYREFVNRTSVLFYLFPFFCL